MRVIDSHTEGEPTRVIVEGGPPLGDGPLAQRRERFAREFDHIRRFAVTEPHGHEAMVGALLCEPHDPSCAAGVIFFDNAGYLGMCGHGTIGLAVTLAHMGRLEAGAPSLRDSGRDRWRRACRPEHGDDRECRELPSPDGDFGRGRRPRDGARRRRLGRQLVLPHFDFALRPRPGEHWPVDPGFDLHSRRAGRQRRNRQGRRADRARRDLRAPAVERRKQPQFRPLPRRRLRPFALRDRDQRQARLPPCRWEAASRRGLGAGEHHRQPFPRHLRTGPERRRPAADRWTGVRLRRKHAASRTRRTPSGSVSAVSRPDPGPPPTYPSLDSPARAVSVHRRCVAARASSRLFALRRRSRS